MKDYSRKSYISNNPYPEYLKTNPSKAVWNVILEVYPFLSEFSQSQLGSFDRSVEDYLRQSERKKPYNGRPFEMMEDEFEGFPGIWPDPTSGIDFPWSTPGNLPTPDVFAPGGAAHFSVNIQYCYCEGGGQEVTALGSQNILSISPEVGSISNIVVNTPKNWTFTYTAPAEVFGAVEFTVKMLDPTTGLVGNATDSIIKCSTSSCCDEVDEMTWDTSTSATTINRSGSATVAVQDGKGTYAWSVSGTGFTLDEETTTGTSNTLNADASACGTATITVTDACETIVTGEVRCNQGSSWQQEGGDPNCCGGGNTVYAGGPMPTGPRSATVTSGGTRQSETVTGPSAGSTCEACGGPCGGCPGTCSSCLTWGSYRANSSPICFNGFSGLYPDLYPAGPNLCYCADHGASQCGGGSSRQCTPANETVNIYAKYNVSSQICEKWECI